MAIYLLRRTLGYAVMLFIAVSLAYLLASTQLDPRRLWPVDNPNLDWANINESLRQKNINPSDPVLERYWEWLKGVFRWDWGEMPRGGSVNEQISVRMWVSLRLVTLGFLIGITVGVTLGAWTATRQYKASDRIVTLWSLVVISTPVFVIIIVAQILATYINRWTGANFFEFIGETGRRGDGWWAAAVDRAQHLLLPTITLAIGDIAIYSRYQRNLMLDTLGADYVRTARAKGLSKRRAVFKHALRTALIPTGTFFAFSVAGLMVGATFTELLYGWNGMGSYLVSSINGQDINGVAAVTAFTGVTVFVGAILSEIFVVVLDPRVRV